MATTTADRTATVHQIHIDGRKLTKRIYDQLDEADIRYLKPMGRVRPKGRRYDSSTHVVGPSRFDGTLVKAEVRMFEDPVYGDLDQLPLIIL